MEIFTHPHIKRAILTLVSTFLFAETSAQNNLLTNSSQRIIPPILINPHLTLATNMLRALFVFPEDTGNRFFALRIFALSRNLQLKTQTDYQQ
jgi:hypothetical protein